ncbi:MAG: CoA pyrophosphatase [Nitriliruptoraceae bacterium]|nr:CoA pyrophosphatase [Nitriliruptoraceae bacterium]
MSGDRSNGGPVDLATADLEVVRARLADHEPRTAGRRRRGWEAATALVLAPRDGQLALAVIERTQRPGDRWSGQMALPGGKRDATDPDLAATARRETLEEVGLTLGPAIGRLDDHHGRTRPGTVACYVFGLAQPAPLVPQPSEVASAWWLPLPALNDPARRTQQRWSGLRFPGIAHEGRVIWGLTLGTLERFLAVLGHDPAAVPGAPQR